MGYAVLALLLGTLVAAGFLLPTGEPKELRQRFLRAGAYLVIVFLIIAVVLALDPGCKAATGTLPSHRCAGSLSHDDFKAAKSGSCEKLTAQRSRFVIFRFAKNSAKRKSNTLGFLARSPSCGQAAALPVMPSL